MLGGTLGAATQASPQNMQKDNPSVLVVGAGLIGSSVAMHLAKKGCPVQVLEATKPASGASGKSWAWLNANRKQPAHYRDLSSDSMKLWGQYPDLAVFPGTVLLNDDRPGNPDYPSSSLTQAQLSAEEPALSSDACQAGARLYLQEGYAYPATAVEYFLSEAQRHGAHLLSQHPVQSMTPADTGNTVKGVVANGQHLEADVVVLAAALGTPDLAQPLGLSVPLTAKPRTVTLITKPLKPLLRHIVVTDKLFIVQRRGGDVMISLYSGEDRPDQATAEVAEQVIQAAAKLVPELAIAECDQITAGLMPYPVDAHPIVGFTKQWTNLYIAVMHSGATLAPLMGKLIAEEVVNKRDEAVLAPYRLQRDFSDRSHTY